MPPSRDRTLGNRGCIFCSSGGSGDFAAKACPDVWEQIEAAKARVRRKMPPGSSGATIAPGSNGATIAPCLLYTSFHKSPPIFKSTQTGSVSHHREIKNTNTSAGTMLITRK